MKTKTVQGLEPMTEIVLGNVYYHKQQELIDWCCEHVSTNYGWRYPDNKRWGDDWGISTMFGNTHFYFLDENDALMFLLRWGD